MADDPTPPPDAPRASDPSRGSESSRPDSDRRSEPIRTLSPRATKVFVVVAILASLAVGYGAVRYLLHEAEQAPREHTTPADSQRAGGSAMPF